MISLDPRHPYAKARMTCTLCFSTFCSKGTLKRHLITCTGPKAPPTAADLICPKCDKQFGEVWQRKRHQRTCTGPKVPLTAADLTCPKCDKQFNQKWNLQCHQRTCTGPKVPLTAADLTCLKCDKQFSYKSIRDRHMVTCTGPKVPLPPADLTCDQCGFVFTTAFSLNRHRGGCGVVYTCAKGCGATFTDRRAYCKHENACTWRPRVLFCRVCGDRPGFYDEAHYAEHVAKHHTDDPELPPCAVRPPPYTVSVGRYTCTACGFAAITMAQFCLHCQEDHDGIVTAPKWNGVPERGDGPLGTEWDFDSGTYATVQADDECRPGA